MSGGLMQEIAAGNQKFIDNFVKGDMTAVSMLYCEDGKLMPTGRDEVTGRADIAEALSGMFKAGVANIVLKSTEVGPLDSSTICFERGHYIFYNKDGTVFDEGKYIVIWKKIDGTWHIYNDIFNTNLPPSA